MSAVQKDTIYGYQLARNNPEEPENSPLALDEGSIAASGILDEHLASEGVKALKKNGVVTMKITKKFNSELAKIPAWRQKQLVDLLFWWEEESHRLRKLYAERAELQALSESARRNGAAEVAEAYESLLRRVKAKIRAKPSERDPAVEKDQDLEF